MLIIAPYCDQESVNAGTTDAQYKAAIALINVAMNNRSRASSQLIEKTKGDPVYRAWWRIKPSFGPPVTYRAIIEITAQDVIVHAVLPKHSRTYEEAHALWLKYRSPK